MPYIHPYPSLGSAEQKIAAAEAAYTAELKRLFPIGTVVGINHWRGAYFAKVVGYEPEARRLILINLGSGKRSRAYPGMRVGITDSATPCVVVEG
jgi:hypothetical protein